MRPGLGHRVALLAVLAAGAALLAGCGDEFESIGEVRREGLRIDVGGLDYNVFITRQLNLSLPEDSTYFDGPPAPEGSSLFGVFIEVCNHNEEGSEAIPASERLLIEDTQGNEFEPIDLPESNEFAYNAEELAPDECLPPRGSVAQLGPTGGAMLLFELPLAATENRPLELLIAEPRPAGEPEPEVERVELDI